MDDKSKLIEHFYSEAIKHEIYSEVFLKNSKQIAKFYREKFGMTPFWLEYYKNLEGENTGSVLNFLEMMKIELLKLDKS